MFRPDLFIERFQHLLDSGPNGSTDWDELYKKAYSVSLDTKQAMALLTKYLWEADVRPELEGLTEIPPDYAFDLAKCPKEIILPSSVRHIGHQAFSGAEIAEVRCLGELSIEAHAFHNSYIEVFVGAVSSLGLGAFSDCESLRYVDFTGSTFRLLTAGTFFGCSELIDVTLPASLVKIGSGAFKGCRNLDWVHFQGTTAQWQKVKKEARFELPRQATIECTDGKAEW